MLHLKKYLVFIFYLFYLHSYSQNCQITLSGKVMDIHHEEGLDHAFIYIEENGMNSETDESGSFIFKNICQGNFHFNVSHFGCQTQSFYIKITNDTTIVFNLEHHSNMLEQVVVNGKLSKAGIGLNQYVISGEALQNMHGKDVAQIASYIPGVSVLKNGSSLNKPIINGLYGNRVSILNQGIPQEGQQWGNDHAPEIDAFTAQNISVVKGSAAVRYGTNAMAGVLILESQAIKNDPHPHGQFLSLYNTNGRGFVTNAVTEQSTKLFNYRLIATLKKSGDQHTSNYFLTNTGSNEINLATLFTNDHNSKWYRSLFVSNFNSNIGILRGAHIGNLTDLKESLTRETPFYTKEFFSYNIAAPKQHVNHFLIKQENKISISNNAQLSFDLAFQRNKRKEYDVRRSGRDSIPALNLDLWSQWLDGNYTWFENDKKMQFGLQNKFTNNSNVAGTGILPLIPNYTLNNAAVYLSAIYPLKKLLLEVGTRLEDQYLKVAYIDVSNNSLVKDNHRSLNFASNIGFGIDISSKLNIKGNAAYISRAALPHELYSNGLHQGIAAIEEGNKSLGSESSFKYSLDTKFQLIEDSKISLSFFHHRINDYIYLAPAASPRLTIRGAFPVFQYNQANTILNGVDLMINHSFNHKLDLVAKCSYINSDKSDNEAVRTFLPPFYSNLELSYLFNSIKKLKDVSVNAEWAYNAKQKDFTVQAQNTFFIKNPASYHLFNLGLKAKHKIFGKEMTLSIRTENILNTTYRNYLNRLRYFANDTGRNITTKIIINF